MNTFKEINKKESAIKAAEKVKVIGEKIKKIRHERHLTQQDVAFYIYADKSLISELERGCAGNITVLTLMRLADFFMMNIDELFCG